MVASWWLSGLGSSGERTVFLTYRPSPMEEGSSGGGGFLISFPVAMIQYPDENKVRSYPGSHMGSHGGRNTK